MKPLIYPLLLLFACLSITAQARLMRVWQPEELAALAEVICEGTPTSVTFTADKVVMQDVPMRIYLAKIKVAAKTKGDVSEEIELRFRREDHGNGMAISNGPEQIRLEVGKKYRFYLKKGEKGIYVGVLDDSYDDGFAVVPLEKP
jgi:hypothetical protein